MLTAMLILISSIVVIDSKSYIATYDGIDRTWLQANEHCYKLYHTALATIVTAPDAITWIGLNDNENEGVWVFANGFNCNGNCDSLDIWAWNEPNNRGGAENCGVIIDGERDVNDMINDVSCDLNNDIDTYAGAINILCDAPYEIITDHSDLNWNEANEYCNEYFGTELATIHNDHDAYSILELIQLADYESKGITRFFIGLTDNNNEGIFVYTDGYNGEPYLYWRDGEPNNADNYENCVAITGFYDIFDMFNDVPCNWHSSDSAFICNPVIYINPTVIPTTIPTKIPIVTPITSLPSVSPFIEDKEWIDKEHSNCPDGYHDLPASNPAHGIKCEQCPSGTAGIAGHCTQCSRQEKPNHNSTDCPMKQGWIIFWAILSAALVAFVGSVIAVCIKKPQVRRKFINSFCNSKGLIKMLKGLGACCKYCKKTNFSNGSENSPLSGSGSEMSDDGDDTTGNTVGNDIEEVDC